MKKVVMWVFFLTILISVESLPTITSNQMILGVVEPVSTKCVNDVQVFSYVQYSAAFTNPKGFGISLMGFSGVVQSTIFYQAKITKTNSTHVAISASCHQDTLFTRLRFSYIVISTLIQYLDIYSDCYLCPPQDSVTGDRTYQFSLQSHILPYSSQMTIYSSISGFNISNVEDNRLKFEVYTSMVLGDDKIYQKVLGLGDTVVSSICITTIIYDFAKTAFTGYSILISIESQLHADFVNEAVNIQPSQSFYEASNSMYYGISGLNMVFSPSEEQTFLFDMAIPSNLNSNFKATDNIIDVRLSGFFIRILNCADKYDPATFTCSPACPAGLGPNSVTNYCQPCHPTCVTCQGSGINMCLSCSNATVDRFRTLSSGECICTGGYIEPSDGSLTCLKCSDLIENCQVCSSSTSCTTCVSPAFAYNSVTNKCGCTDPTKFLSQNTICLPYAGCLTVKFSLNVPAYCETCDQTKNFIKVTSNDTCKCKDGYDFDYPKLSCKDKCGDGVVLSDQCDDGNQVNGDGCSDQCKIETGWDCFYDSAKPPSVCMAKKSFAVTYEYCYRDITSNQAQFFFILTPPEPELTKINLAKCFKFSFPYQIKSYTYDPQSGDLMVNVQFQESIEGQTHKFSLNFGSQAINSNSLQIQFTAKGMNSSLNWDKYAGIYFFVIYGMGIVCILAWVVGLIATLMGYKHLTVQLFIPIQALYFIVVSENVHAPGFQSLEYLKFINGYNSLNGLTLKQVTSANDTHPFYLEYLSNQNYFILVDVGCLIILFILQIIYYFVNKKLTEMKQQDLIDEQPSSKTKDKTKEKQSQKNKKKNEKVDALKKEDVNKEELQKMKLKKKQIETQIRKVNVVQKIVDFVGHRFCCVILLLGLQDSIFFLGMFVIYTSQYNLFSVFLNDTACLGSIIMAFIALVVYPCQSDTQIYITIKKQLNYSFTKLYIMWYIVCFILLIFVDSFEIKGMLIAPVALFSLMIVLMIAKNPYNTEQSTAWRKFLPIIQQILLLVPDVMIWIVGFFHDVDPLLYFLSTCAVIACCFIAIIFTIVRIVSEFRYWRIMENVFTLEEVKQLDQQEKQQDAEGNNNQSKQFETKIKEKLMFKLDPKDPNGQKTLKKVDQKLQKKKDRNFFNDDHEDTSNNEQNNEEDLQLIKKRLRQDLKSKRALRQK